jgi:hypothetical protein
MRKRIVMWILRWLCSIAQFIDGAIGTLTLGRWYTRLHIKMIKMYFAYSVTNDSSHR